MRKIILIILYILFFNITSYSIGDTIPKQQVYYQVPIKNNNDTTNQSYLIVTIITVLFGASAGIWGIIKIAQQNNVQKYLKSESIKEKSLDYNFKNDEDFQQGIVKRLIDEYVNQNSWITTEFSARLDKLITDTVESNKLIKDIYAQLDITRRELREYQKQLEELLKKGK